MRVVVLGIYYKIILEVVTRIATGMFQQGLSLGSFKNSFVGDFGALSLSPSPKLIVTPRNNHIKKLLDTLPAIILRRGKIIGSLQHFKT